MTVEEIAAVDRNGYKRGWLDCKERLLKAMEKLAEAGAIIAELNK